MSRYRGHKNVRHTVRYTELAPNRFRNFWGVFLGFLLFEVFTPSTPLAERKFNPPPSKELFERSEAVVLGTILDIKKTEEKGEAEYLIAEAYYHLGEFSKAQTHYEQFLKEYPGHRLEREVL